MLLLYSQTIQRIVTTLTARDQQKQQLIRKDKQQQQHTHGDQSQRESTQSVESLSPITLFFKIFFKVLLYGVLVAMILLTLMYISGKYYYRPHLGVPRTVEYDSANIPHITLNGRLVHAETFGSPTNPIVIVLHGGPGLDYRSMLSLKDLASDFFVVFYDQRGTGILASFIVYNLIFNIFQDCLPDRWKNLSTHWIHTCKNFRM